MSGGFLSTVCIRVGFGSLVAFFRFWAIVVVAVGGGGGWWWWRRMVIAILFVLRNVLFRND